MNDDLIRQGKIANDIAMYMAENAYLNDTALDVLKMIAKWVNEQPAVDAVEVVRCMDCKHSRERNKDEQRYLIDGVLICTSIDATDDCCNAVWPEHYCSYGVRREDDG